MAFNALRKKFAIALLGASILAPAGLVAQEPSPFNEQQSESRYFGRSDDPVLVFTADGCTKDGRVEHAEIWTKMSRKDMLGLSPQGRLIPRGALLRGVTDKWQEMVGGRTLEDIGKYSMPSDDFKAAAGAAFAQYAAARHKETGIHHRITVTGIRTTGQTCKPGGP